MNAIEVLGVKVNNMPKKDILDQARCFLCGKEMKRIVTVNPEFVLEAQENQDFLEAINKADLNVADGIGINLALWKAGKIPQSRMTGADLIWDVLEIADRKKLRVFLVANRAGMSNWRDVRNEIRKKYPFLKIDGMNLGVRSRFSSIRNNRKLLSSHVLFCNFGAPHQELFINSLNDESNIRLAMGVGGSFDFISGKIRRAPKWMRFVGLEWLWRLFVQPRRIKRILKAVIVFPIKIILNK
ncbi:MAG: WecB/TagA/CpsF family glycosyltransferase [Candidatus Moranbacteria bacterium]|nr:WecB/TagA/CpsF family glycosyltransferase [Candidatus Moranbacteria bacterium]